MKSIRPFVAQWLQFKDILWSSQQLQGDVQWPIYATVCHYRGL